MVFGHKTLDFRVKDSLRFGFLKEVLTCIDMTQYRTSLDPFGASFLGSSNKSLYQLLDVVGLKPVQKYVLIVFPKTS